jgi:ABC-2 type transport system ATP-binding protein
VTHAAIARVGLALAATAVAASVAPGVAAADPSIHPPGEALAAGLATGVALFVLLARRRPRLGRPAWVSRRRLTARCAVLAAVSAREEALWRGLLLGLLVDPLGRAGAVVLSTVLFAGAHVSGQGRVAAVHLLTGGAFAAVYVATGRLLAAIAAHGAYNVLVGAASLADPHLSDSDTGARANGLLASRSPSRPVPPMRPQASPPPELPIARLVGVVKRFGPLPALAGVDLELRQGEVLALLGPNGAGKSTAVAIMLGLRGADAGRATLFGLDPRLPQARARVGAVLQDVGFPPGLRVHEAVDLVRAHYPGARSTESVLAHLGLTPVAGRDAGGLSGGQRRRLAVALALAGNPTALFLDEPTAGMDAGARRTLLAELRAFAAAGGSVLLTTQQLDEAEGIATRIVLLVRGRVVLEGSVREIRARAGRARVTVRAAALPLFDGASVDTQGDRHVVYVEDADAFVSALVRSETPFSDLEVVPVSLEDAFVALTAEGNG